MVRVFIENVLFITKYEFIDHLKALEKYLQKLMEAELKVNAENSLL